MGIIGDAFNCKKIYVVFMTESNKSDYIKFYRNFIVCFDLIIIE